MREPSPPPKPCLVASSKPVSVVLVTRMSAPFDSPVSIIERKSFTPFAMLNVVGPVGAAEQIEHAFRLPPGAARVRESLAIGLPGNHQWQTDCEFHGCAGAY